VHIISFALISVIGVVVCLL